MEIQFHNSNEVFSKILNNPTMTRAYVESEEKKKHFILRPVLTVCALALVVVSVAFINNNFDLFVSADFMAETNKTAQIYDNSLVDMETTRGEEVYSYSISIDNNLVVPKGYNLIKSEFYENDIFKYEYQNENKDYIVVTNEQKSGVLHLESLKINEIEVYVYANAITKQEAQKILSSVVDN